MGPFATGFLYVREALLKKLEPICVSAISDKNVLEFTHHDFHIHEDAKKFQSLFNPSYLAMGESIKLLNDVGISNIEQRIYQLTDYLIEQLKNISTIKVDSYRSERIIANRNTQDLSRIVDELLKKYKIVVSFRDNGIRVSPHFYNTFEEIDEFVTVLKSLLL